MSKVQGKDVRPKETPSKDFDPSLYQFGMNRDLLSLDPTLQMMINDAGLDRRFMNAPKFRRNGGRHNNYRRALNVADIGRQAVDFGSTPEGTIVRDDLVLGLRDK